MKTFQQIQEGVYDLNIFNAIFLAGGFNSGKSQTVEEDHWWSWNEDCKFR